MNSKPKAYHYTVTKLLNQIFNDGYIKPATAIVPKHERPVVWLSMNPFWEETAYKSYFQNGVMTSLNRQQTHDKFGGLARIEVPFHITSSWNNFKKKSGILKSHADALASVAINRGTSPKQWRVSYGPISESNWIGVELFNWESQMWEPHRYAKFPGGGGSLDKI
ncbi:MAG: hypothetical protein HQL69_09850 [Magnetococcales bacterium]|nr:hypothetical protein [Magnetococcales bacterium]